MFRMYQRASLRLRMLVTIALPLFLLLSGIAVFRYYEEKHIIGHNVEDSAHRVGAVLSASLQHAMLKHDLAMIATIIEGGMKVEGMARVQLIDENSKAVFDSQGFTGVMNKTDSECSECHRYPAGSLPKTYVLPGDQVFRVATPIENSPECNSCHDPQKKFIGVLLLDISARQQLEAANQRLIIWFLVSLAIAVLVFIFAYWRMQRLFANRIESFTSPLAEYGKGNLSIRLPVSHYGDEIDQIATLFNQMAGELELFVAEKANRDHLLQRTIIEERERIARELHDSLPQLLAYLNTKLGAISLYVESGKKQKAIDNLEQLETAINRLFSDIREAIIGLKMSRQITKGLVAGIRDYIDQFTQLCGLKVDFTFDTGIEESSIDPQTQIHLLRIVQEGLSNVRKYARATKVLVSLLRVDGGVQIVIEDNGVGFDPQEIEAGSHPHFGLQTMRERAEVCGGLFMLESQPSHGTKITVSVPLRNK